MPQPRIKACDGLRFKSYIHGASLVQRGGNESGQQIPRLLYLAAGHLEGPPTDWVSDYGQSVWQYEEHTGEYYLHMNAVKQADLNWENPKVRQSVYEMMRFWLDKGVDGLRIDQLHLLSKKNTCRHMKITSPAGPIRSLSGQTEHGYMIT